MTRPTINLEAIEAATRAVLAEGNMRVFQSHRFGGTDLEHVAHLLDWFDPPRDGCVLDAGCGVGEVSKLMHHLRPDLSFVLANISDLQLSLCPGPGDGPFMPMKWDCHKMPLSVPVFDAVMFSSALVQMDEAEALAEAARVTRPGGVLLVNEMTQRDLRAADLEQAIGARVLPAVDILRAIEDAGWRVTSTVLPAGSDAQFRELLARDNLDHYADAIQPLIVRAVRQ